MALEDGFERFARASGQPAILLCDRGLMDGSVYMPPEEWAALVSLAVFLRWHTHVRVCVCVRARARFGCFLSSLLWFFFMYERLPHFPRVVVRRTCCCPAAVASSAGCV